MQQIWAELMDALDPAEVEWILNNGREQRLASGSHLVEEDTEVDAIYFLIEGLLHATTRALGGQVLGVLGPGEVVGEISFIDRQRASATVSAAEDSLVLVLPREVLEAELETNPVFAAGFYRELARIACRRLRSTASRLGGGSTAEAGELELEREVAAGVEKLKRALIGAEEALDLAGGELPAAVAEKVRQELAGFTRMLNASIGELLDPPSALNQQIGRRVQGEVLPWIRRSQLGDRLYVKPRGYGGDFQALELVYANLAGGEDALGALVDRCLLETPGIAALRRRRQLFAEEIRRVAEAAADGPARVMGLACGPATEVFDVFAELDDPKRLQARLVDVDFQALLHIEETAHRRGLKDQVQGTVKNLVYLALGRTELDVPAQDLVYSLGLVDDFNDSMVVRILDQVHGVLRPGGRVLLGTFHPRNPSKALFDHVLEWPLVHRTADDVNRLFERSLFGRPATEVRFEPGESYFVAECVRSSG